MDIRTKNPAWSATLDHSTHGLVAFVYDDRHHTVDFILGATSMDEVYDALGEHIVRPEATAANQTA